MGELCVGCLEPYKRDPMLVPALAALARERSLRSQSGAWWSQEIAPCADEWHEACVRLKMSEFLCLVAHLEAVESFRGERSEDLCLDATTTVRGLLVVAFGELATCGRF